MFSGSYTPEDVIFLLKPVTLESTAIAEKERLIQSGARHYSEMITRESLPSKEYLSAFHHALELEKFRFARHLLQLARQIRTMRSGEVVLVSLARAGTPVGVLLKRILSDSHSSRVHHYSISIIRDRGIDETALKYILDRHCPQSVVFVDGWTGKGVIARELHSAVTNFNCRYNVALDSGLFAVADLCGAAAFAASTDDYLIPSSILGATISGLVSRSILNERVVGPGDFHGCLYYKEFEPYDLSRWFVNEMMTEIEPQRDAPMDSPPAAEEFSLRRQKSAAFVTNMQKRFGVRNVNHIKPGVGEATRVLLRRVPQLLLLRESPRPEVEHLQMLAREKNVPIVIDPDLAYLAAALVQEVE